MTGRDEMLPTKIPGFSAETSLYKVTWRFQSTGSFARPDTLICPAQGVTPWPVDVVGIGDLDTEQSRTYGTVTPVNEDKFNACVASCRAGGRTRTFSDCWRSCCEQITGFQTCVIA